MAEQNNFKDSANNFFKRLRKQDLIRVGDDKITSLSTPITTDEIKQKNKFSVFRQHLQQKNWSTRHLELIDVYKEMDKNYPIISAALRIYCQEVCLTGDTKIQTPMGVKTIKELYTKKKNESFYVSTVDLSNLKTQWGMAAYIKNNGIKPVFKVIIEKKVDEFMNDKSEEAFFRCTDNHKIMLPDGKFKMLSELKVGDDIFSYHKYMEESCRCSREKFQTVKILDIIADGNEEVFDLVNVEPFSHFSIFASDTMLIQVHNCTKDDDGNIIKIHSDNAEVKKSLEDLFFKTLKINTKGILLVKEMLKFGNTFGYLNIRKGVGVTDIIHLPSEQIRIEFDTNAENLDDYYYKWIGAGSGGQKFEPHEIVHWKNIEDIDMQPYGTSILRSIVDTYRRIILMRESLIIYRITRAPQRYLFKIDTTGLDPDAALLFAEEVKKDLYKKPLVDPITGQIDFKYNPLSIEENFYLPTQEGSAGGIEVLDGASNMNDVEDYKIIQDDLFAGLLIPKAYLTFEEDLCLRGDTEILTNSGKFTIKEIADNWQDNKKVFTLSCNQHGYITPGKVLWCKKTMSVNTLYKITINNDLIVESTNNHPFMLTDLTYKRADELTIGENLNGVYNKEYIITNIEVLEFNSPIDVYDLEVEEHHNFALATGVFVHNSNKAALSQEDIRFSGGVKQYQAAFVEGLIHIALVHLVHQGFSKSDLESFSIEMNTSSKLLKKLENETMQQQIDLAKSILELSNGQISLMSMTQVLRDILHFSEEQIRETFEHQVIERKMNWRLTQLTENGFYKEPEENELEAKRKRMGEDDIFSNIKFESVIKNKEIKSLISESMSKEVKKLLTNIKESPTHKQIEKLINLNTINNMVDKVKKDLKG